MLVTIRGLGRPYNVVVGTKGCEGVFVFATPRRLRLGMVAGTHVLIGCDSTDTSRSRAIVT